MTQQINHQVSLVNLKTGSKKCRERANFTNQIIQKGRPGLAETAATGALLGGFARALIGLTIGTVHTIHSYSQKESSMHLICKTLENRSIE